MKGDGIRFITAANCDVLPRPKHCSQGEDPVTLSAEQTTHKPWNNSLMGSLT